MKENHKLTKALILSLGVFQNSTNELEKLINPNSLKGTGDKMLPLYLIEQVEKNIQTPQILAMLGDTMIEGVDASGNKISKPVFDVNNHKDPHPAFELINGVPRLRKEFANEENKKTWEDRNSQEYADLFGDSGVIPKKIAKMNGDYRGTSTTKIKRTILGGMLMTFKTWFPMYIKNRFNSEDGIITKSVIDGHAPETLTAVMMKALTYSAMVGGGMMVAPITGAVTMIGIAGVQAYRKGMVKDVSTLKRLQNSIKALTIQQNFGLNTVAKGIYGVARTGVGVPLGAAAKLVQKGLQVVTPGGKTILSDNDINYIVGMTQGKNESDEDFEANQRRMHFLLSEFALTLQILLVKIAAMSLMMPDEEEEEAFKKAEGWEEKMSQHKLTMAYYFVENMSTRLVTDINLESDISNLMKIGSISTADDIDGLFSAIATIGDPTGTYSKGYRKGQSKALVQLEKQFIPIGIREMLHGSYPTFNIGSNLFADKVKGDLLAKQFDSPRKQIMAAREDMRKDFKEKKLEEFKETYKISLEKGDIDVEYLAQKALNATNVEFPPLTIYFNEKGEYASDEAYRSLWRFRGETEYPKIEPEL